MVSAAADIASGAMWTKLTGLLAAGHLLGATHKDKHEPDGAPAAAAMPDSQYRPLVYPVVELREAQGLQMVTIVKHPHSYIDIYRERESAAAMPDSQYRPLVYPVVELREAQGLQMVTTVKHSHS